MHEWEWETVCGEYTQVSCVGLRVCGNDCKYVFRCVEYVSVHTVCLCVCLSDVLGVCVWRMGGLFSDVETRVSSDQSA